jgi:hypothetical protein
MEICHYHVLVEDYVCLPIMFRAATATKASKAWALPKFWVTVNPISTRGADYAHHSTMGLVWLKFAVAPLMFVLVMFKDLPAHLIIQCKHFRFNRVHLQNYVE